MEEQLINTGRKKISAPVKINSNVLIGYNAIIMPGISIGECSIVGAGSVLNSSIPPYSVVSGNPAKIIRYIKS